MLQKLPIKIINFTKPQKPKAKNQNHKNQKQVNTYFLLRKKQKQVNR